MDEGEGYRPLFALGGLGWKAFQDLCGTVLRVVLGQTVTTFRPTRDAGRDFAFEGAWAPQRGESLSGAFVVQCKFKSAGNFYRSDLRAELPKIRSLVKAGRCDVYILMTNAGMTAATEAELRTDLVKQGVKAIFLAGGDQIDQYLRESSELRARVPRMYGLGDLTEILDDRRYAQASALLASQREDISKFVITSPYHRGLLALTAYSFVLLTGAPAAGKSMIAASLAIASIDMWQCRPMKLEDARAFSAAWNPREPDQFFWIDDAFGATQYQRQKVDEWNQVLPNIRAALLGGARVVVTTRDYIWAEAAQDLKTAALPVLGSGQVVVDVHDLTLEDKRQILYNHLKFGNQPKEFRTEVKPHLEWAARVDEFLPEVARRFGDPRFTRRLIPGRAGVVLFFEHPLDHLEEVVAGLGADEFASLVLIFLARGRRPSPVDLNEAEAAALARLGSDLAGVLAGLNSLRGSLVVLSAGPEGTGMEWAFKHPTIGEAVRRVLARNPEHLEMYLRGTGLDSLLAEVTCGDVGREGSLVVPERLFGIVAERLADSATDPGIQMRVANFLVTRCSDRFLGRYGASIGRLEVDPGAPGGVRIAYRLHQRGLLNEAVRSAIVDHFVQIAVDWLDLEILDDEELRELVTPGEMTAFLRRLHDEVVPHLESYVEIERDNFDGSVAPDDIASRLRQQLETLVAAFPDDDQVREAAEVAEVEVTRLESDLSEDWHGGYEPDDDYWRDRGSVVADVGIFADVDE